MEFLSFITTLLSVMIILSPCLSHPTDLVLSSSHEQVNHVKEELSLTKVVVVVVLPRKLRLMNEDSMVKSAAAAAAAAAAGYISTTTTTTRDFKPAAAAAAADTKRKKASPKGTKLHNHSTILMDGRKGTRQNWIESNSWQYFTMDYAHVRRRRHIHNKSMPRGP